MPACDLGRIPPLSAITIQALADPYALPPPSLAADIAEDARILDLSGDILPGPIKVIDNEGNIVRVIGDEAALRERIDPVARVVRKKER